MIFCKPEEREEPIVVKPRNIIIQWESPQVNIKKEYKYLGVIKANPIEYINRYGDSLTRSSQLPHFVREIKNPRGLVLAADEEPKSAHELYGDVHALSLVDLEREGLSEYREQLSRIGVRPRNPVAAVAAAASTTTMNRSSSTAMMLNTSASGLSHSHSRTGAAAPAYFDTLHSRPPRQRPGCGSATRIGLGHSSSTNSTTINNSSMNHLPPPCTSKLKIYLGMN